MDNQLERIIYDHQRELEQLAQLNSYITAKKEGLERLKDCDDCTDKDRDYGAVVVRDRQAGRESHSPKTGIFTLNANGAITGDPARITQAVYACIALTVIMVLSALLLLSSPYISYKLAFGQVFEAVSTTASGWLGAFAATGLEIAGLRYGTALQRQAGEARIEGQYQAEQARALAIKDASNLTSRAQQILGLQSAAATRSQALGAISTLGGGLIPVLGWLNEAGEIITTLGRGSSANPH